MSPVQLLESLGWKFQDSDEHTRYYLHPTKSPKQEVTEREALFQELRELRQSLKDIAVESAPYMGCCDAGCTLHEVNEMALAALGVDVSKITNHEEAAAAVVV